MTDWNLFAFQEYRQQTFPVFERLLHDQQDGRASSNNTIDASELAESVLFQVVLGQSSLHQLDQWLRCDLADTLLDRSNQPEFGSDSTLLEAADGWDVDDIRRCAKALTDRLVQQGRLSLELPGHRTVRPAALDGSNFGGHFFSVLTGPGSDVQSVTGSTTVRFDGRGTHGLLSNPSSTQTIRRVGPVLSSLIGWFVHGPKLVDPRL